MGSTVIENLRKMFVDQNIWEKPPSSPEKPSAPSPRYVSDPHHRKNICHKPEADTEVFWSSSKGGELSLNQKNCTEQALPHMRGGNKHRRGGEGIGFANNVPEPVALTEAEMDAVAFRDNGLNEGEKAPEKMTFIPWKFLVCYPDMYVGKANNPLVAPYFEDDSLLNIQPWNFFYVFEPDERIELPMLLVPTGQLDALLRRINKQHGINLRIPSDGNEAKFYRHFGDLGTPLPRYLGRTSDVASCNRLLNTMPLPEPEDDISKLTQEQRDKFADLMKKCNDSWRVDGKGKHKKRKAEQRLRIRKEWGHQTKRVQRYMGLREKVSPTMEKLIAIDTNYAVPFKNEGNVVFICFDLETYEKSPGLVTELGFAILDTQDLVGVPPGEGGQNWFQFIRARHIRIKEYSYLKNTEYVMGCPDSFIFGTSEFTTIDKVLEATEEIMSPKWPSGELRKVVCVGHDVKQDIALLKSINFDVYEMSNLLEVVDNQKLHQHRNRFYNGQGLSVVLAGLDISYMYLHNAGNDAVYTLQSLLRLAVLKRQESLVRGPKDNTASVSEPQSELNSGFGWSTGGEDTDGGVPELKDPRAMQNQMKRMQLEDAYDVHGL